MAEIPKIGKAADIKAIIDDLAADSDIEELVTVRFRRDEHGELVARYDYTRTISRFRMSGAMLWAAVLCSVALSRCVAFVLAAFLTLDVELAEVRARRDELSSRIRSVDLGGEGTEVPA